MNSQRLIQIGTVDYRRLSLAMVMAGLSSFSLLYNVQPLLPLFSSAFGVSPENASLSVSIATGPMAVGLLIAGWLSDAIGRRKLIMLSLISATFFGCSAAFAPNWETLLILRFLCGIALAGVPAVAITYVSEEVESAAIGPAIGLYIGGSAIGGMIGRVGSAALAEWFDWRLALGAMGFLSAASTALFCLNAPASRTSSARKVSFQSFLRGYIQAVSDRVQLMLYACGYLMMGAFMAVYNYVPFRLTKPPYDLSFAAISAIALLYILGSASSAYFGRLSAALGIRKTFWVPVSIFLVGVLLTIASALWLIVAGIGMLTIGFFGAHSVASSWVSKRAFDNRTHASALYLFAYYVGSSVMGSVGGKVWSIWGWSGVAAFSGTLCVGVLLLAVALAKSTPLADPRQPREGQELPA